MELDLLNYKSVEELQFSWFLDDLKHCGYVSSYNYEPTTFKLFESIKTKWQKVNSKGFKDVDAHLTAEMNYTPDFFITFTEKAFGVFCNGLPCKKRPYFLHCNIDPITNTATCVVDVKGSARNGQNTRNFSQFSFPLKQKILLDKFDIYAQKVIPEKLFKDTFIPSRLFYTDGGTMLRKLTKYKNSKNIMEYVKTIS